MMDWRIIWRHVTRHGPFFIRPDGDGRFAVFFRDEHLGSYSFAEQAAADLAIGKTKTPSCGSTKGLVPTDLGNWDPLGRQ